MKGEFYGKCFCGCKIFNGLLSRRKSLDMGQMRMHKNDVSCSARISMYDKNVLFNAKISRMEIRTSITGSKKFLSEWSAVFQ